MRNISLLIGVLISINCLSQNNAINVNFLDENWKTVGTAGVKEFDSKLTTYMSEGVGIAYLDSLDFENGIIECDLYSPVNKTYLGIVFRIGSLSNFEYIYFQPHTSGKWDAIQYDPIFNSSVTWQIYNGESYQAMADIPARKWFRVKVHVIGDTARVYLDNDTKQALIVKLGHDAVSGSIGVCSYHPAYFANLCVTKIDTVVVNEKSSITRLNSTNYISNWLISDPFDNYTFSIEKPFLNDTLVGIWRIVGADKNHIINLNRYISHSKRKNTVLAKAVINSSTEQIKKMHFGFSDKINVYLNSEKIFTGDNSFIESDNFHDRGYVLDKHKNIELQLKKGDNELILEIAEKRFGWGFVVQLDNLSDVDIVHLDNTK